MGQEKPAGRSQLSRQQNKVVLLVMFGLANLKFVCAHSDMVQLSFEPYQGRSHSLPSGMSRFVRVP